MVAKPRFQFVATLGVHAEAKAARRLLGDVLGFSEVSSDAHHVAFAGDQTAIFVDTTAASVELGGFTPLFACEDLDRARTYLVEEGCKVGPMPWKGPGLLVEGPGGLRFCVAQMALRSSTAVVALDPPLTPAPNDAEWEEETETVLGLKRPSGGATVPESVASPQAPLRASTSELETRAVSKDELASAIAKLDAAESPEQQTPTEVVSRAALAALLRGAGFELHPVDGAPEDFASDAGNDGDDEETALRPAPPLAAPSFADPPVDDAPYSEFDAEDATAMGKPSTSLLDRAGGHPDVTQLGAPSRGLLNRLARKEEEGDAQLAARANAEAQAPSGRSPAKKPPAPASRPVSDSFADDDETERTKHHPPRPELLQDELLLAERKRERQEQRQRVRSAKSAEDADAIDGISISREQTPSPTKREPYARRRPRPASEQVQSAAENFISSPAQLPEGKINLDDDTARESPRSRRMMPSTEVPDFGSLSSDTAADAPLVKRPPARPRRAVDAGAVPRVFDNDDDDDTAAAPRQVATEDIGGVFTETNDDGSGNS